MRVWEYRDQEGIQRITDSQILEIYYSYWQEQMKKVNKESEINPENCIQDFAVIHWAYIVEQTK